MASSQSSRRHVVTNSDAEVDGPAVLSMSDLRLAQCYQFVEETGVGNWGSVWLGRDKTSPDNRRVALKVVHRSTRSKTSGVRVRSLWNEMKIIRPINSEQHPSIVSFNCFIITPSYAIIAMEYLPTLMQVEIDERRARPWFASLASAIEWLHARGVVHNDIKPANILLSEEGIPKLVDFGFAERYELKGPHSFESQLAYGTPEYLCPERAKGNVHDTRKSDVWSLAITFFEILTGRTPFEREGESFSTKEELETYWKRTVSGRWLDMKRERSNGRVSPMLEALLKRMLAPNARIRLTAAEVCKDSYWSISPPDPASQVEAPFKRRFSIFSELSTKSGATGKSKTPSRTPLGGNKSPTPTATLTRAAKAANASMASSQILTVPRKVVSPEPQIAKENVPPSAFRRPNCGKTNRKPLARVFDTQMQTAAVNFGDDDDSSPNLLCQSQSSIFSLRQAVRNDGAKRDADADHSRMSAWIESLEKTVENTKNSFVKRDPNALPPAPRDLGPNHSRQSSKNIFTPLLEPDPVLSPAMDEGEEQGGSSTETQRGKLAAYRPPKAISHDHDTFLTPRKRRATVTNIFSTEASDVVAQTGETRRAKSSMQLIGNITPMERQTPPSSRRVSKRLSQIINDEERDMFFSSSRGGSASPAPLTPEPSLSTPIDADVVDSPFRESNVNTISSSGTGMSSFYDRFLVSMTHMQSHTEGLYNFDLEPRGDASIQNKTGVETQSGKKRGRKLWASSLGKAQVGKGKSPVCQDEAVDDFGCGYLDPTADSRISGFGVPGTPTSERSSFSKSKVGGKKIQSSVRRAFNIFKNVGMSPSTPSRPIF